MGERLLEVEQGLHGGERLAEEISQRIISRWETTEHRSSANPFILLVGGLQGSGKTTTVHKLQGIPDLDFVTISADEIRWEMFAREVFLTAETANAWTETVNLTRNKLLREAVKKGYSVVLDQMITKERKEVIEEAAREVALSIGVRPHTIKTVYYLLQKTY